HLLVTNDQKTKVVSSGFKWAIKGKEMEWANSFRYLRHKSIQAALKLFIAKPLTQMLYGAQLGLFLHYKSFEAIETIFF
ncbi:hypothetical protein E2320_019052, partial [Naja naja]